jgi:hypothetical protein
VNNYLAGGKKMKKFLLTMATVVSIFALAGTAFALVNVNVTSEPIRADATCDKAGGFTLTFGSEVSLVHGDQITIDLTYGVTLCRNIDILIAADNTGEVGGTFASVTDPGWDLANANDPSAPVYIEDASGNAVIAGGGVYFHLHGNSGSQRITIDIIGEDNDTASITLGDDPDDDKLTLKFLDQQVNADFVNTGIWVNNEATDYVYDDVAPLADNTICINVSHPDFSGTVVRASLDSKGDKFTFDPSDPQVAHLAPSIDYDIAYCEKAGVGRVELGSKIGETQTTTASESCNGFDFETLAGYCTESADLNNKLLIQSDDPYESVNYQIRLEILVNGESGANGVYWSNESVRTLSDDDDEDLCDLGTATHVVGATYEYLDGDGDPVNVGNIQARLDDECDVANNGRAVVLTTDADNLGLVASDTFLWIDLPALNYDIDEVAQDDEVSVVVTLIKAPCGELFTGEVDVGILGCTPATPPAQTSALLFPYFTPVEADDAWWDGIAIINLTANAGTVTVTLTEMDGDVGTLTVTLPASGMYLNTLSDMLDGMTLDTSVEGTLGNSDCYIILNAEGTSNIDGFAMMGYNDGGWGIGYLPRRNW